MSFLYVIEQGSVINYEGNRFNIRYKDERLRSLPAHTLEAIQVFGSVQITTQALAECLKRNISLIIYSRYMAYFGRLVATNHVNVTRQRLQASLSDEFNLAIAKNIIKAKIHNQKIIIKRCERYKEEEHIQEFRTMDYLATQIDKCTTHEEIMGYEGIVAKMYFKMINQMINPEFHFDKRSRRPPLDPFNSLISLGYHILFNDVFGKIEAKGLNAYFGVLHKDHEKHPTLASDLMEEWRPVLIDALAINLLNNGILKMEDFQESEENNGIYLTKDGFKKYIRKLEEKMHTSNTYLSYIDQPKEYREEIFLQVQRYCMAIEQNNPNLYLPVHIR